MAGKSGGGCKKIGRNKDKCKKYKAEGTREKNKARRAAQIVRGFA